MEAFWKIQHGRRAATALTADPMIAKRAALQEGGVALVFKVRSSSSRPRRLGVLAVP